MCRPVLERLLRVETRQQPVDQPRGERISAAHAVEDLQARPRHGLVEASVRPADRAPVVARRAADRAQRRGHRDEVRIRVADPGHHLSEATRVELGQVLVDALDREAEGGAEVLLVAEHHVDERGQRAIHLAGAFLPADGLPQGRPVVEVVGDDGAVPAGGRHRLRGDVRRRLAERREDAAAVEPAGAFAGEDLVPVDVARPQLADGGVAPVGAADGAADAEASLGEVEPVAHLAADTVVGDPAHVRLVDAALEHQVLDEPADRVVGQRRDDRGPQPEAAAQAAGDVVLAAALADLETPRGGDAALAGIQPEHDLAEGDEVPAAVLRGT